MRLRSAFLAGLLALAVISLVLAITASVAPRLGFVIGSPQNLPVLIFETHAGGEWSVWHITSTEELISRRHHAFHALGLLGGGQTVANNLVSYEQGRLGYVIQDGPASLIATMPAARTIRNGRATSWKTDFWQFFFLFALYPAVHYGHLYYVQSRNRRKEGYCIHCGYDLTGNTSGVCPECGQRSGGPEGKL